MLHLQDLTLKFPYQWSRNDDPYGCRGDDNPPQCTNYMSVWFLTKLAIEIRQTTHNSPGD